jgi:hypothetical protein
LRAQVPGVAERSWRASSPCWGYSAKDRPSLAISSTTATRQGEGSSGYHLDVWQIHEVVYYNDPDLIFRADGAIEALELAQQQGKVRWVGFTGHKDPAIHLKMLSHVQKLPA